MTTGLETSEERPAFKHTVLGQVGTPGKEGRKGEREGGREEGEIGSHYIQK